MAEKGVKWTRQQMRAIRERGKDVLVTASAGTGKTAVLSGRCVDIVSDASVCPDVWSVLVLTFTDAAAEEMRSRIAAQLREAFSLTNDPAIRGHLRRQLILLSGADISTIHSFCKRLITENFYHLGLDPAFGIIDSDEQRLLKAEVNEKVIEWAWQQGNIRQGLELLLKKRDLRATDGFLGHVIEISDFLDGVVSREDWFRRSLLLAEAVDPFNTELGARQKQILRRKLQSILGQLRHVRAMSEDHDADNKWLLNFDGDFMAPVEACLGLLEKGDWDRCAAAIREFQKPRVFKPKGVREDVADLVADAIRDALKRLVAMRQLAILNPDYLDRVGGVGLQTKVLIELVKKFDQMYGKVKKSINCLDFADLEHYALKLLSKQGESEEALEPSDVALALRRQYKYIFVDEYQDINPVQQAILDLISGEGNVFVVGDIKQSIYAFRGAEPHIFLNNLQAAKDGAAGGVRVDLNANFRSNRGVLDFVNKLFGRIMTAEVADIDYDESARLRAAEGVSVPSREAGPVVEMHLLDDKIEDDGAQEGEEQVGEENEVPNVYSSRQRQAAMIAARIKEMVGIEPGRAEFQVYDKRTESLRPVEYRDIVVLMRSPVKRANDYVEVFRMAGVPVSCQATSGYFEATEVTDMLSLLKVLDNPRRDIELAAVLRSPLFGFSDSELARASVETGETEGAGFYERILAHGDKGHDGELANKLRAALMEIDGWRIRARRGSLADLIWKVYSEKGYLAFVSALPNGRERKANLLKLHDRAIQFEGFATSAGIPSLGRFVEFIEKIIALGQDWTPAEAGDTGENVVRIISVHRSKGLEFPVVFLAELNSRFNFRDVYKQCLVDRDGALGLQVIDSAANARVPSLAHQVIAEQRLATTLAEEMRILYVATTRARERLILTASQKSKRCRQTLLSGHFIGDGSVPAWQLRSCASPLDWILYGLSNQRALHEAFGTELRPDGAEEELFSVHAYGQEELRQLNEYIHGLKYGKVQAAKTGAKRLGRDADDVLRKIKEAVTWEYGYKRVTGRKAKLSVSQMTHGDDEYAQIDYSRALERRPKCIVSEAPTYEVDSLSLGTATHLLISKLDLTKPVCEAAIREVIGQLAKENMVSETAARAIDIRGILRFFETDLGKSVLDGRNRVWREWAFSLAMPAFECGLSAAPDASETVIVQGIVDMLLETADGLVVIDFKTDRVSADDVAARAESYRTQLEIYGRAAEAIINRKISSRTLYFLSPGAEFKIL